MFLKVRRRVISFHFTRQVLCCRSYNAKTFFSQLQIGRKERVSISVFFSFFIWWFRVTNLEMFLTLEGLLLLIVRHTEDSHPRLVGLVAFGENTESEEMKWKKKMTHRDFHEKIDPDLKKKILCQKRGILVNGGSSVLLCHEWHVDCLPVELRGVLGRLSHIPAIHEPEPSRHGCSEIDTVLYKL